MLEGLIKIILIPITALLSLVSSGSTPQDISITPTPTPANVIVATGTISEQNVTVDISVTMPQDGGAMSGSVSGACEGDVNGTYDGNENGILKGTLEGTCGTLFLKTSAIATFSGTVAKTKGEAVINYSGKADTYTKDGTATLYFTPVE